MTKPVRLFGMSGSLRNHSHSTAILHTVVEATASEAEFSYGDIGALPHYNQDHDGEHSPDVVKAMRKVVAESDGIFIATTEYNHSIPGVLKNAIDWLSRPAFHSVLAHKPTLFITSSHASTGGVRAQAHMREAMASTLAHLVVTKEVVIASVHTKITNERLTDKASVDFLMDAVKLLIADARVAMNHRM